MRNATNVLLALTGWHACFVGAAKSLDHIALFVVLVVLAMHFLVVARDRAREAVLVVLVTLFGAAAVSANVALGSIEFDVDFPGTAFRALSPPSIGNVPLWTLGVSAVFATTLPHALASVARTSLLALVAGMIGGPFLLTAADAVPVFRVPVGPTSGWLWLLLSLTAWAPACAWLSRRLLRDGVDRFGVAAQRWRAPPPRKPPSRPPPRKPAEADIGAWLGATIVTPERLGAAALQSLAALVLVFFNRSNPYALAWMLQPLWILPAIHVAFAARKYRLVSALAWSTVWFAVACVLLHLLFHVQYASR